MSCSLEIIETKLFAGAVADEIIASVNDTLSEAEFCSFVLAGGKTPSVIYRTLSKAPRGREIDWSRVKLLLGDERWVPRNDTQSNLKMVTETLVNCLSGPAPSLIEVDTSSGSPEDGALAYAASIRRELKLDDNVIPSFDLVLLGVGEDGHTASLFPGTASVAAGLTAGQPICLASSFQGVPRVSLSAEAFFSAKRIIFIVRGESKAAVIKKVLCAEFDPNRLPAQLYREARGHVTFFLDTAAAQQLEGESIIPNCAI